MEDIFYRQMPHSLEAEQSVLGSMLIDANCVKDVMEQLRLQGVRHLPVEDILHLEALLIA